MARSSRVRAALAALALLGPAAGCGEKPGSLEVSPNPIDFGEVVFPETVVREVTLSNGTGKRLFLRDPTFGCPCFLLRSPAPTVLGPGESARLSILMDSTKTDPRRFSKTMNISADGGQATLEVPVVGEVVQYRRWSTERVDLGPLTRGNGAVERRVPVWPGDGFRLEGKDAVSSDLRVGARLVPTATGVDLVVTVPADAAPGLVSAQVRATLVVEGRGRPPRTFTDSLYVTGAIQ